MANRSETLSTPTRGTGLRRSPALPVSSGCVLLAGLYLLLSPWVIQPIDQIGVEATNVVTGIVLALLGFGCARSFDRLRGLAWITPVIGAWVVVAPWVTAHGTPASHSALIGNVVAGAVTIAAGAVLTALAVRERSS